MAALVAACSTTGVKQNAGDSINSVIATPAEFVGKDIKVAAKLVEVNDSVHYVIVVGEDSTKTIVAKLADTVSVCPSLVGKCVELAGSVVKDEDGSYYVAATSVSLAECCKKEGGCAHKPAADSGAVATDSAECHGQQ